MNMVDKYGITALHIASIWGYSEIVKILIEAGTNVNVVNVDGRTALQRASFFGYSEIVKMLEKAGAK